MHKTHISIAIKRQNDNETHVRDREANSVLSETGERTRP